MSEKKELSQSFKERFASELKNRSEGTKKKEKIRPEDMSDEEYLWYTIRKKWREETKEKERLKNLEDEEEKREQEIKIPLRDHVDINNSDTLDGKKPTLKVFDY
jgi:hypothetical protein